MDVGISTIMGDSNHGRDQGRSNHLITRDQHQQTNTRRGRGKRGDRGTQGHGNTKDISLKEKKKFSNRNKPTKGGSGMGDFHQWKYASVGSRSFTCGRIPSETSVAQTMEKTVVEGPNK